MGCLFYWYKDENRRDMFRKVIECYHRVRLNVFEHFAKELGRAASDIEVARAEMRPAREWLLDCVVTNPPILGGSAHFLSTRRPER